MVTDIKPSLQTLYDSIGTYPSVNSFLRPNGFRFTIKDIPDTAFACQSANLPSLTFGSAQQNTPFVDIPRIGDKLLYGDLNIRFMIAEDMSNYLEIFEWMVALGFPNNYTQYPAFINERLNRFPFYKSVNGNCEVLGYSDGILTILDSNNVAKTNIMFRDLFPVSIQALNFDASVQSIDYFIGDASFKYRSFEIEVL